MICNYCGGKISNNESFCSSCGAEVSKPENQEPKPIQGGKTIPYGLISIAAFVLGFMFAGAGLSGIDGLFFIVGILLAVIALVKRSNIKKAEAEAEWNKTLELSPIIKAGHDIENGILPVFENTPIIRKGELAHFYCKAVRYITKNQVVGHHGSTAGVSFRIAKGVSLRTGGYGGKSIRADVTGTFLGEFVMTNKRFMFIHGQQGFESTIDTLGAIMETDDGKLMLQKGKNTCILNLIVAENKKTGNFSVINGASSLLVQAIALIREQDSKIAISN